MSTPQDPGGGPPPGTGNVNTAQAEAASIQQQTEISERIIGNIEKAKELTRLVNERNDLLAQSSEKLQENLALQNSIFNILGEQAQRLLTQAKTTKDITNLSRELVDAIREEATLSDQLKTDLIDRITFAEGLNYAKEAQLEVLIGITREFEKQKALSQTIKDAQADLDKVTKKVTDTLGMSSKFSETTLGSTFEMVKRMQQAAEAGGDFSAMLDAAFGQAFNLKNILGDTLDSLKDMVLELDKISKKLSATTGLGNVFQSEIMTIYGATFLGGGTMQEAADSISALATGFAAFNPQATKLNEELGTTIVNLTKIGVTATQSVKTIEFFSATLGLSARESSNLTVELAMMGQQMGVTSKKMIEDFTSVADNLAIYGERSVTVFKDIAAQAKATGIAVNSLIGVAEQFNQFDKAADSASKLNAVLGTQLSTLQLLSMDYDDRLSYLRQEVQQSVGNFSALDQYTQMYVAQAMGLKSAAEAQRFLNMSQGEFLKYQSDMEAANKRQEDLEAMTRELVPVMQQFKLAFMQIAMVLSPYVSLLAQVISFLAPMLKFIIPITLAYKLMAGAIMVLRTAEISLMAIRASQGKLDAFTLANKKADIIATYGQATADKMLAISRTFSTKITKLLNLESTKGLIIGRQSLLMTGLLATKNFLYAGAIGAVRVAKTLYSIATSVASVATLSFGSALAVATGGLTLILPLLISLLEIFGFKINPFFFDIPKVMGESFLSLGGGLRMAAGALRGILNPFGDTKDEMAAGFSSLEGLQNLDVGKLAADLEKVKSVMIDMAMAEVTGVLALKTDGTSTSLLMGSKDVIKDISEGKLTVDVKMPDMKAPNIELKIEIEGEPLRAIIRDEVLKYV